MQVLTKQDKLVSYPVRPTSAKARYLFPIPGNSVQDPGQGVVEVSGLGFENKRK